MPECICPVAYMCREINLQSVAFHRLTSGHRDSSQLSGGVKHKEYPGMTADEDTDTGHSQQVSIYN